MRGWLDNDAYNTTRHFETIVYFVGSERYQVKDKRPYPEPPAVGSTVHNQMAILGDFHCQNGL